MHKKKIKRQFKNFRIYKDLYGKPSKRDWVAKVVFLIQMLLTFGGRRNRNFWDIRLKILRLPTWEYALSVCANKMSCLRAYRKLSRDHTHAKTAYCKSSLISYPDLTLLLYVLPCCRFSKRSNERVRSEYTLDIFDLASFWNNVCFKETL